VKSNNRGYADHEWLKSYHTFSFAQYYNPKYLGFGALNVINEDRVAPRGGFPEHPHRNYEIFSYIVSGELQHKDSMGYSETVRRGDVQFISSGSGIFHSEYNRHPKDTVHFLQVWIAPSKNGLEPSYRAKHFSDREKRNTLRAIVAPNGKELDCITINQDVTTYASILDRRRRVEHVLKPNRKVLVQMITTSPSVGVKVTVSGESVQLQGGDVLFVYEANNTASITIEGYSDAPTEFLMFDIGK
jgi:hypothetical protein